MNRTKLLALLLASCAMTGLMFAAQEQVPLHEEDQASESEGSGNSQVTDDELSSRAGEEVAEGTITIYNLDAARRPVWISVNQPDYRMDWKLVGSIKNPTKLAYEEGDLVTLTADNSIAPFSTAMPHVDQNRVIQYQFDPETLPVVHMAVGVILVKGNPIVTVATPKEFGMSHWNKIKESMVKAPVAMSSTEDVALTLKKLQESIGQSVPTEQMKPDQPQNVVIKQNLNNDQNIVLHNIQLLKEVIQRINSGNKPQEELDLTKKIFESTTPLRLLSLKDDLDELSTAAKDNDGEEFKRIVGSVIHKLQEKGKTLDLSEEQLGIENEEEEIE